jgi:ribulose kinase
VFLAGGQSATGSLIDHMINSHPAMEQIKTESSNSNLTIYEVLNNHVSKLAKQRNLENEDFLTAHVHILPYFHGNRSPRADPSLSGIISGFIFHLFGFQWQIIVFYLFVRINIG